MVSNNGQGTLTAFAKFSEDQVLARKVHHILMERESNTQQVEENF